jgi:hypothetical protein
MRIDVTDVRRACRDEARPIAVRLRVDAERRPIWITPQQAAGAARGRGCVRSSRTAKQFNPRRGCRDVACRVSTPSCASLARGYLNWTPFGVSL